MRRMILLCDFDEYNIKEKKHASSARKITRPYKDDKDGHILKIIEKYFTSLVFHLIDQL